MGIEISLSNHTALVTGGGRGIGRETALLLARAGANVCVADLDGESARRTAEEIGTGGGRAIGVTLDVTDPDQARTGVAETVAAFGALDILVNNAAAWTAKLFRDISFEEIQSDLRVSLLGTIVMSQAALEVMRERERGTIVNLVSDSGRTGEPFYVVYGTAKGGVLAFTKGLAKEVARHNIRVNAVSPGATRTPGSHAAIEHWGEDKITRGYPLGRIGEPIDQANAILFFCSELSSWVTGQVLSVNGGFVMPG